MILIQVGGHKKNNKSEVTDIKYAIIDDEDYQLVSAYKWSCAKRKYTTYAQTQMSCSCDVLLLHRLIMGLDFGDKRLVNHKDGNGLNNQKANLEICDALHNNQSINKPNSNKGYVYYNKLRKSNNWRARITINKKHYEKHFATEEEGRIYIDELLKNTFIKN